MCRSGKQVGPGREISCILFPPPCCFALSLNFAVNVLFNRRTALLYLTLPGSVVRKRLSLHLPAGNVGGMNLSEFQFSQLLIRVIPVKIVRMKIDNLQCLELGLARK